MTESELQKNVAEDLKAVLEEARSMGCTEVKAFYHIPLKNVAVVVEALEKQIAKKPVLYADDCLECPTCDSFIGYASDCKDEHYQANNCSGCGQKLDWREV